MSAPARWTELDRRRRSREILTTAIAVILAWILLFGAYYLVPFDDRTSGESLIRLVIGIAAFIFVLALELHGVKRDAVPGLRAIQALGGAVVRSSSAPPSPDSTAIRSRPALASSEATHGHSGSRCDRSGPGAR